jgi:hypothetical protein
MECLPPATVPSTHGRRARCIDQASLFYEIRARFAHGTVRALLAGMGAHLIRQPGFITMNWAVAPAI